MTDDLEEIVSRYREQELTLEEAIKQADMAEREFVSILNDRDIEIRRYPLTKDNSEIIAYLAREMIVPERTLDGYAEEYGLSPVGRDIIDARSSQAREVIERLGISSDEKCEGVRKQIEDHPEWGDNIPDEPPDYVTEESRK